MYIVIAGYNDTEAQQALNVKIKYVLAVGISLCYICLFADWFMNQDDWQLFAHAETDVSPPRVYLWLEIEIVTIPCFFVYFFLARFFYNLKCSENKLSGAAKFVKQQTELAAAESTDINSTLIEESKTDIEQEIKTEKKEISKMNKHFEKHTKYLALEQDFFSFTVLCFVKKNIDTYKIDDKKLAKLLYQS